MATTEITTETCERGVLIVEDQEDLRNALSLVIEDEGFHVANAGDGRSAIDYLSSAQAPPCVILLDLMLPEVDGWQVLTWLKRPGSRHANVPVVLVSAAETGMLHHTASTHRCAGVVEKPIELNQLLSLVEELCAD